MLIRLGFVTAIVIAIVTVAVAPVSSAEIVTVCKTQIEPAAAPLSQPLIRLGALPDFQPKGMIALARDEAGFDILENWGESSQHSLRDDGDSILGLPLSDELVHVMVEHKGGSFEHFLFSLDVDGSGELLRSAEGDVLSSETGSANSTATCTRPR